MATIRKTFSLLLTISFFALFPLFWFDLVTGGLWLFDLLTDEGICLFKIGCLSLIGSFVLSVISYMVVSAIND